MVLKLIAFGRLTAVALSLSLGISLATHAEFHASVRAIEILFVLGVALSFVAALLIRAPAPRLHGWLLRIAAVSLLMVPLLLGTGRVVFAWDLFRLQRFVAREAAPRLERERARRGSFQSPLVSTAASPPTGPWLLALCQWWEEPGGYLLRIEDPGVCGHTFTYDSRTRSWTEGNVECWY